MENQLIREQVFDVLFNYAEKWGSICTESDCATVCDEICLRIDQSQFTADEAEELINQEVEKRIKERMPSGEDKAIRKFFLWMVREANIEVIDAEKAIEVHSLESEVGLVPVISIDELIEYYRFCLTCSEKPNNSQKTEGGAK